MENEFVDAVTINNNIVIPDYKWSHNNSKVLIDLYGKYKGEVGTLKIKNTKMLWSYICTELKNLQINVTPNNCMNRWRVLERNYKKFVDNQNKTGRGRKYFEYKEEMEEIFGKKKNIHPELLLSTTTIDNLLIENPGHNENERIQDLVEEKEDEENVVTRKVTRKRVKKTTVMEKVLIQRKTYYDAKLEIEKQKLEEIQKRNKLLEGRNKLIEERNEILKGKTDVSHVL